MSSDQTLKVSMAGYGSIAEEHVIAFKKIGGISFGTLVGRRPQETADFAREHGFARYTFDYAEALKENESPVMVITTPNGLHYQMTRDALSAGKHVLLEVPAAMSYQETADLARRAQSAKRRVLVCHTFRFTPTMQNLRERILSGEFGRVHMVQARRCRLRRDEGVSWKGRKRHWLDSAHWHHGSHEVDLLLWITGKEVAEVKGFVEPAGREALDSVILMRTEDAAILTVTESFNSPLEINDYVFFTDKATIVVENSARVLIDGKEESDIGEAHAPAVESQNREFLHALKEDREPCPNLDDVLPAMKVLQEAEDSGLRQE